MGRHWRYGIVLDAGSSGTRLHVYKWETFADARIHASEDSVHMLPRITLEKTEKIRPGVSAFADNPAGIGPDHLQQLIDVAEDEIPHKHHKDTPIFLMATAGMRLLPEREQKSLLAEICTYFKEETKFHVSDCDSHVRIISGETEGLYGWIAANYLLGGFDHPEDHDHGKNHHTIGFLDMGGASAQIAFAPNTTEAEKHSNDLKLVRLRTMDGKDEEYKVFVATWLGFGANQARTRYIESLKSAPRPSTGLKLDDPCMPKGLTTTLLGELVDTAETSNNRLVLQGTGDFQECLRKAYPLLGKDVPCEDEPCLLNGKHVPGIDFDVNHFIGVSEFWHTTHGVFGKSKGYDLETYQEKVIEFCGRDWHDIEAEVVPRKKSSAEKAKNAQEACFKAAWLMSVLYDGIGIPRVGVDDSSSLTWNASKSTLEDAKEDGFLEAFKPVNKVDGVDLSWTLGKMVLYSSGQIPPSESNRPVGFGSNTIELPADFEYAGSTWKSGDNDDDDHHHGDDIHEIISHSSARSVSAVIFLLLVGLILGFCLRKADRRHRIYNLCGGCCRKNKRSAKSNSRISTFTTKLFRRGAPTYERVMEEGEASQFELDDVDSDEMHYSDSSEGSRTGRAGRTGRAAAEGGVGGAGYKGRAISDQLDDNGLVSKSVMDRSGLVVRTESRERLSSNLQMSNVGRKSRATSPTRGKSPLGAPWQNE